MEQDWWLFGPFYHNTRCPGSGSGSTLFREEFPQRDHQSSLRYTEGSSSSLKPVLKKKNSLKIITKLNPDRPERVFRRVQSDIYLSESANVTYNFNNSLFCESPTPIDTVSQLFCEQPSSKKKRIRFSTSSSSHTTIYAEHNLSPIQFHQSELEPEEDLQYEWIRQMRMAEGADFYRIDDDLEVSTVVEKEPEVELPKPEAVPQISQEAQSSSLSVPPAEQECQLSIFFRRSRLEAQSQSETNNTTPNQASNPISVHASTGTEIYFKTLESYPDQLHKSSIVGSITSVISGAFDMTSLLLKGNNRSWW